jgi:hypothetical protein
MMGEVSWDPKKEEATNSVFFLSPCTVIKSAFIYTPKHLLSFTLTVLAIFLFLFLYDDLCQHHYRFLLYTVKKKTLPSV